MKKRIRFDRFRLPYWPAPEELAPYFLASKGHEWSYLGGNESWGMEVSGLFGSQHLPVYGAMGLTGRETQVEANLEICGNPELGVLLCYSRYGGSYNDSFFSAGDLSRMNTWVRTLNDDLRPVGLYIPFRDAWPAVKEFMETDGELPKCIPWIAASDLPENTFPDRGNISFNGLRAINDKP